MMAPSYSVDLRERVLQFYDEGNPVDDVVQHFAVSRSWVYGLLKQRRETGTITPKVRSTRYKTKLAPHEQEVRNSIAEHADATLSERCTMLEQHVSVSRSTLCRFLKRLKITFKKNSSRFRTTA
jgi:putative transposase